MKQPPFIVVNETAFSSSTLKFITSTIFCPLVQEDCDHFNCSVQQHINLVQSDISLTIQCCHSVLTSPPTFLVICSSSPNLSDVVEYIKGHGVKVIGVGPRSSSSSYVSSCDRFIYYDEEGISDLICDRFSFPVPLSEVLTFLINQEFRDFNYMNFSEFSFADYLRELGFVVKNDVIMSFGDVSDSLTSVSSQVNELSDRPKLVLTGSKVDFYTLVVHSIVALSRKKFPELSDRPSCDCLSEYALIDTEELFYVTKAKYNQHFQNFALSDFISLLQLLKFSLVFENSTESSVKLSKSFVLFSLAIYTSQLSIFEPKWFCQALRILFEIFSNSDFSTFDDLQDELINSLILAKIEYSIDAIKNLIQLLFLANLFDFKNNGNLILATTILTFEDLVEAISRVYVEIILDFSHLQPDNLDEKSLALFLFGRSKERHISRVKRILKTFDLGLPGLSDSWPGNQSNLIDTLNPQDDLSVSLIDSPDQVIDDFLVSL
ncbi:hypothetical protein GEMRC1_011247 [Eukaryota sp. GEM-RC1]